MKFMGLALAIFVLSGCSKQENEATSPPQQVEQPELVTVQAQYLELTVSQSLLSPSQFRQPPINMATFKIWKSDESVGGGAFETYPFRVQRVPQ